MNCGMECIKYLIFIFNFVFALGGLAILAIGVLIKLNQGQLLSIVEEHVDVSISMPATVLIVVGAVIFVIAFFGCCGAARESHCMIVTFAVLLLALLVIQVIIAVYTFMSINKGTFDESLDKELKKLYDTAFETQSSKQKEAALNTVNVIQSVVKCCGYKSYREFKAEIPYSCCNNVEPEACLQENSYKEGCGSAAVHAVHSAMNNLGGLALGIAAIELFGVIFSFCLANSIRNVERRGYKV